MPRAQTRTRLHKMMMGLDTASVATDASIQDNEVADQEIQIKKVLISGISDQRLALTLMLTPPGIALTETSALDVEYVIYRFHTGGTGANVQFLDTPAIRVPEGHTVTLLGHNHGSAPGYIFAVAELWYYAV